MNNIDEKKSAYLKKFNRENYLAELGWNESEKYGKEIVDLLQTKEGLTYEEAYASLQYAYNLLKYNSNFILVESCRKKDIDGMMKQKLINDLNDIIAHSTTIKESESRLIELTIEYIEKEFK